MITAEFHVDDSVKEYLDKAKNPDEIHRRFLVACQLAVTKAKFIITEKRHVITGNLRRSIQTKSEGYMDVLVGAGPFLGGAAYAYYVEMLPDGGFLKPAVVETIDEISKHLAAAILEDK